MRTKSYLALTRKLCLISGFSICSQWSFATVFNVDCDTPGYTPLGQMIASMESGDELNITGTCDAAGEGAPFIDIRGKQDLTIFGNGATTITVPVFVNGSYIHFQNLQLEATDNSALGVGQNSYVSAALTNITVNAAVPFPIAGVTASASSHISLQGNSSLSVNNSGGDAVGVNLWRDSSYVSAGPINISVDAFGTATGVLVETQGLAFVGGTVSVQGGASSVAVSGEMGSQTYVGNMIMNAPVNITGGSLQLSGNGISEDVSVNATLNAQIIVENGANVLGELNLDFGAKALVRGNSTVAYVNTFGAKPDEVLRIELGSTVEDVNKKKNK